MISVWLLTLQISELVQFHYIFPRPLSWQGISAVVVGQCPDSADIANYLFYFLIVQYIRIFIASFGCIRLFTAQPPGSTGQPHLAALVLTQSPLLQLMVPLSDDRPLSRKICEGPTISFHPNTNSQKKG